MALSAANFLLFFLLLVFQYEIFAQQALHGKFPQEQISKSLNHAWKLNGSSLMQKTNDIPSPLHSVIPVLNNLNNRDRYYHPTGINIPSKPDTVNLGDTIVIGFTPGDTLYITGTWIHSGPIILFNDGVLIFDNASATIIGDLFVLGRGKVLADNSYLYFPQQYWYQRSITIMEDGYMNFSGTTLDYGGFPHGFAAGDSAVVEFTDITNIGYTTTGMWGDATILINGDNLTGEFIISDRVNLQLKNATQALLWHHFPDTALINHTFPSGTNLYSYTFNSATPGVSGINYSVTVDSSLNVEWALMPTNGSDVTISNSTIRSIGVWFEGNDTSNVSGLVNNSNYANFTVPLSDRNLHLINTSVQTWSLYPFDHTVINVSGCIVGEVGAFGRSMVSGTNFWVDGSGGYCFGSDTALVGIVLSNVTTHVRSERNGIVFFAYSTQNNGVASAIGNSILIVVQSTLPQDPLAYEGGVAWYANISQPGTHYVDSIVPVTGTAFIDRGPSSFLMDFSFYRMYYQKTGDTAWLAITGDVYSEVRNNMLASWNTYGLQAGSYTLRMVLYDNWGDSVEANKPVTLLPSILVNVNEQTPFDDRLIIYPNPCKNHLMILSPVAIQNGELKIFNLLGQEVFTSYLSPSAQGGPASGGFTSYYPLNLSDGSYLLKIISDDITETGKLEITR